MDPTLYKRLIGSLLYLTANRPDIMYNIGMCARYQSAPNESHLIAAKRTENTLLMSVFNQRLWGGPRVLLVSSEDKLETLTIFQSKE